MIQIKNKRKVLRYLGLLLCLMLILSVCLGVGASAAPPNKYDGMRLIPGGMTFGVRFALAGVVVVGFCDVDTKDGQLCPATDAGLRAGDMITTVNGVQIKDAEQLAMLLDGSSGRSMEVAFTRSGEELTVKLSPKLSLSEKKYRAGLCVRDSGAGIGTVTYILPDTLEFAGLGHGICSADSGRLMPMTRGVVSSVTVSGIKKGVSGVPGEIKGVFGQKKLGTLIQNTDCGVFGVLLSRPEGVSKPIPVGLRGDLCEGEATLLCTLDGTGVCQYKIQISNIKREETGPKCFTVTVKDKSLIEKTGGIVQGMSGSPIIQNGKLVGAVTHVMINDPTVGYGIFIENMLDTMSRSAA